MSLAGIESVWCKRVSVVTVTKLQNRERRSFGLYLQLRLYLSFSAFVFPEPYGGKQSGWERPVCSWQSWAQLCHFPQWACSPPGGRRRVEWAVRALDSHEGASAGTSKDYVGDYVYRWKGRSGGKKKKKS